MVKYITFNLDAFPLSNDLQNVNDYNAIVVYSAVADPLFKYDGKNIVKNTVKKYTVSFTGRKHTFIIKDGLRNAQGLYIKAVHYKEVLEKVITNKNNRMAYLLDNVKKIIAKDNTLTIFLHKKDFQFYKILSGINFSPVCGLYTIKKTTKKTIILEPNKYHRNYQNNMKYIKFELVPKSSDDIKLFKNKKTDFTSNTNLSHTQIKNRKQFLHVYPNLITCSLSFLNSLFFSKSGRDLRIFIQNSIEKSVIAKLVDNIIMPTNDYFITKNVAYASESVNNTRCIHKTLTLGYDDFYPNYIIAKAIKKQLEQCGLRINLIKDDYFNPRLNYDMKVMLSYPDYVDDISFYKSKYVQTLVKITRTKCYRKYCKQLFDKNTKLETLQKLNYIIQKEALVIPLFKMNSVYLSKNNTFDFRLLNYEQL